MGFPRDDYTPFGLLANPWAEAHSWEQTEGTGGVLRATKPRPGFGWVEPWATGPKRAVGLEIGFEHAGRRFLTREEFAELHLASLHHSANLFEYDWEHAGINYRVRFWIQSPTTLVAHWLVRNRTSQQVTVRLLFAEWQWRADRTSESVEPAPTDTVLLASGLEINALQQAEQSSEQVAGHPGVSVRSLQAAKLVVPPGGEANWRLGLWHGQAAPGAALLDSDLPRPSLVAREAELVTEDDAFWATCPRLDGDWPAEFRRGLVYDFETTRMCLQSAGGIFKDVWPAWMVNWPRAVLAEGTLDMLRLAYAQPELAQRAVLSLFRDALAPNVPCVFKHGEPNMVAADGSICGTSPAWCVPFHNLKRLYLRSLDRAWLAELYPYLAAYVRWWLAQRSDEHGWTVYKCTWEAGEDNSPRLDPDQEGDHVISQYARPVELQAAMADAAATLAFFARELGLADEWWQIERAARDRVAQLWDPGEGRFRDWHTRRNDFIQPSGRTEYWGTDPRRFSPLSLTPLLFGQVTPEQATALRQEIEHYTIPPWCDWPSWSYVVLEAASAAGWYEFAGQLAYDICRRVYAENDRRDLTEFERPMPGVAREYWPSDLSTWNASEGYGWGATTASFVIRQLCGFYETEEPRGCSFRLAPGFPRKLIGGRRLGLGPLPYRGRLLRFAYQAVRDENLIVEVMLTEAARLRAWDEQSGTLLLDDSRSLSHVFELARGRPARLELIG